MNSTDRLDVWLVEDSALQARAVVQALEGLSLVRVFTDGEDMLGRLADGAPQLLLLDWVLPGISGVDICHFVRKAFDKLTLPILMLTSQASETDLVEALSAGANDFLVKPFRTIELRARVESLGALGRLAGAIATKERERNAETNRQAQVAASEARGENIEKDRYIGILGHDLRNPLNAIIMASRMIATIDDPRAQKSAQRISRSAQRMALLIRDVLDFTRGRLGAGIPVGRRESNLGAISEAVVDELSMTHAGRRIELVMSGNLDGCWDADRLEQAISNLVGNALEHSDGVVQVNVVGGDASVSVLVQNGGAAISPAELALLFQPFRKGNPGSAGLGLGLYIVKLVIDAHGGQVEARSSDAEGTIFRFTLPRLVPSAGAPHEA